jgi:hypothetical protein
MTPWHRELLSPKSEGVHETGSTPSVAYPLAEVKRFLTELEGGATSDEARGRVG